MGTFFCGRAHEERLSHKSSSLSYSIGRRNDKRGVMDRHGSGLNRAITGAAQNGRKRSDMGIVAKHVGLAPALLAKAFPFHLAFDCEGAVLQAGPVLRRLCPTLVEGARLSDSIVLHEPKIAV